MITSFKDREVKAVNLSNTPLGNDVNWLDDKSSLVNAVKASNIPIGNDAIWL